MPNTHTSVGTTASTASTETAIANQAIARIGGTLLTDFDTDTTTEGVAARLHYAPTRDALLRSCDWPFTLVDVELVPANAVQNVEISGVLSAGTYTISAQHSDTTIVTTGTIAYDASTGDVQTAINAVLGSSAVAVTGTAQSNMILTFSGAGYAALVQPKVTLDISSLTGATGYKVHQRQRYALPSDFMRLVYVHRDEDYRIEGAYLRTDADDPQIRYVSKVTDPALFDPLFTDVLVVDLALRMMAPLASDVSLRPLLEREKADKLARARLVCMAEQDPGRRIPITWLEARRVNISGGVR